MVFLSCFRSRRQQLSQAETNETCTSSSRDQKATVKDTRSKKKVKDSVIRPAKVKLAPRTTVLQTPKQAVGSRITQATAGRRRPDLDKRRDEIGSSEGRGSLSPSSASSSSTSLSSTFAGCRTGTPTVPSTPGEGLSLDSITKNTVAPIKRKASLGPDDRRVPSSSPGDTVVTPPTTAVHTTSVSLSPAASGRFGMNTSQSDELRNALARRAAKIQEQGQELPGNNN